MRKTNATLRVGSCDFVSGDLAGIGTPVGVHVHDVLSCFWCGRECVCQGLLLLASDAALLFAVQVQKVAKILGEIVDRVDCKLDAEMRGVGIGDRDLQDGFSAAVQLADQRFAVEKPGIGKFVGRPGLGLHCELIVV